MKVGFFVPCYIDFLAPKAAISTYNLLKRFDIDVEFIDRAICCGLPETDMGYHHKSCSLETNLVPLFAPYDAVVVPSGICTDEFRNHFNAVEQTDEVKRIRSSVFDTVEFLHDVLKVDSLPWARFRDKVALHNGCHSLRSLHQAKPSELVIPEYSKPEALLNLVEGLKVTYASRRDECCGFGGAFTIWDIGCSGQMGLDKVKDYARNGIRFVTSADYSCLLHQEAIARRHGMNLQFYYIAEILNGDVKR